MLQHHSTGGGGKEEGSGDHGQVPIEENEVVVGGWRSVGGARGARGQLFVLALSNSNSRVALILS